MSRQNSIGVEVVFTPKAHCELAGRGVEHAWGVSKVLFRKANATLSTEQRTKDLKVRVKQLLESIPIATIGKCARRAREYKLSYLSLLNDKTDDIKDCPLRLKEIEKMRKDVKGKRDVSQQDTSVITNLVSLLEDDDEYDFIKKEKVFVVDLKKNDKELKELCVKKKIES